MRWLLSLTFSMLAAAAFGQGVKFPPGPPLTLAPMPGASIVVLPKQICVIECETDFFLKASPSTGSIVLTKETGPLAFKGEFPDSPGKIQKKTFKGPFLYQVEGIGEVELFSIPVGVKDEKDIKSQLYSFITDAPPDPTPIEPDSKVKPKPIPGTKVFWLVLVEETADRTQPTLINDKAYWDGFQAKGHLWMSYDQSTAKGQKYKVACDKAGIKLPALVVVDQKAVAPVTPVGVVALTSKSDVDVAIAKFGGK